MGDYAGGQQFYTTASGNFTTSSPTSNGDGNGSYIVPENSILGVSQSRGSPQAISGVSLSSSTSILISPALVLNSSLCSKFCVLTEALQSSKMEDLYNLSFIDFPIVCRLYPSHDRELRLIFFGKSQNCIYIFNCSFSNYILLRFQIFQNNIAVEPSETLSSNWKFNTLFRILFGIQQEVSFIQGQGASNSSSSPNTPSASATQQQIESGKSNNMDSESTPNLTHATRVSPATVRMRKMLYGWNCEFSEFHQLSVCFFLLSLFPSHCKFFLVFSIPSLDNEVNIFIPTLKHNLHFTDDES